jgi:VanZ family protein
MMFAKGSKWIAVAGVVLLAVVVADSLVPVTLQVRLGLHWLIEHFLAYFALTLLFCLAWPRPFVVAVALMAIASAIELLQGLTADRIPDLATAFCGLPACWWRRFSQALLQMCGGRDALAPPQVSLRQARLPAPGAFSRNLLYP